MGCNEKKKKKPKQEEGLRAGHFGWWETVGKGLNYLGHGRVGAPVAY